MHVVTNIGRMFGGTHLTLDTSRCAHITRIARRARRGRTPHIPVELDGETPGTLPATFEILPGALRIRA